MPQMSLTHSAFWMIIWLHFQFWFKVVLPWPLKVFLCYLLMCTVAKWIMWVARVNLILWNFKFSMLIHFICLLWGFSLSLTVLSITLIYLGFFLKFDYLFMFLKIIPKRTLWDLLIWGLKCFFFYGKLLAIIKKILSLFHFLYFLLDCVLDKCWQFWLFPQCPFFKKIAMSRFLSDFPSSFSLLTPAVYIRLIYSEDFLSVWFLFSGLYLSFRSTQISLLAAWHTPFNNLFLNLFDESQWI